MKLTVLTDNNTRIDAYLVGEPGVCYWIEDGESCVLFDTGYSDVYVQNARTMGIDLARTTAVVLSHGHNDHTRGLLFLPDSVSRVPLYAHPDVFAPKRYEGVQIGAPLTKKDAAGRFELCLSEKPAAITQRLTFLGRIPRTNDFEGKRAIGKMFDGECWRDDTLQDDSAMVYHGTDGLHIITGCSHAGICNIVAYAKEVCDEERVVSVIGGFHLLQMTSRVQKTAAYLRSQNIKRLCPCHCTCFYARAAIHAVSPVEELCVGDVLEL